MPLRFTKQLLNCQNCPLGSHYENSKPFLNHHLKTPKFLYQRLLAPMGFDIKISKEVIDLWMSLFSLYKLFPVIFYPIKNKTTYWDIQKITTRKNIKSTRAFLKMQRRWKWSQDKRRVEVKMWERGKPHL